MTGPATPEAFFADDPVGLAVLAEVRGYLEGLGPVEVRVSRSQVAFRRSRGFAWLWHPRQYLGRGADVVLAVALDRQDGSPRWKQVAHPSARHWVHHLEIRDPAEVDDEVRAWLRDAADRA